MKVIQSKRFLTWAVVALVATGGALVVKRGITASELPQTKDEVAHAQALSTAFRGAAKEVLPSVVTIRMDATPVRAEKMPRRRAAPEQFRGTPFEDFFNDDRFGGMLDQVPQEPQSGMGSGVIIDPSGVILTNRHVVAGHGKVTVHLGDGRSFDAAEVKMDERTDLAVVKIKGAEKLKAARLGNSDALEVGDWVLAIGNPFGLSETVTAGIISAKGRGIGITDREDFLQTDAAINPGNSGGPLINLDGEVIGINTAISSRSGGYQGVGFAIPINLAKFVSDQLAKHGSVKRAYLGAGIQPVTPDLAKEFGVKDNTGALVTKVMPGSPAEKAGLKQGDIITRIGDKAVNGPRDLVSAVEQSPIGEARTLELYRNGKSQKVSVTVREQPTNYGRRVTAADDEGLGETESAGVDELGLQVGELTGELAKKLGLGETKGVLITEVERGGIADRADLEAGMAITQVNGASVSSVEEFQAALGKRPLKDGVRLLVESRGGSRFVVLKSAK